ncbi:MAG: tRNA 2-selenouridine(34) synthase MnmH, partial [Methylococcales bacterium]|nr:tRNA 2-selenouridine(34) synthase MnmH [Methylococcales bacterium]
SLLPKWSLQCMPNNKLSAQAFLQAIQDQPAPILDVRAPSEFEKGHIPGAENIALFNDEERAVIGTMYNRAGHDEAVRKGLEIVGPKMADFVKEADLKSADKRLYIHCWQGGMRSSSMAWLLQTAGFEVALLEGGYKAYRNEVHASFGRPWKFIILGGSTGSGKTAILKELAKTEQVIDLEGLAHHKGSAFGGLMQEAQPSTQHFENKLHEALNKMDPAQPIWLEDESTTIGKVYLPANFWKQMLAAPTMVVDVPFEVRVERLVTEYAEAEDKLLAEVIGKISKRLGGQQTQDALSALEQKDYHKVAAISLSYYDKTYQYGFESKKRELLGRVEMLSDEPALAAERLISKKIKSI